MISQIKTLFSGLDFENSADVALLSGVQANILKGHGRNFANHIFIRWKAVQVPALAIREWIRTLTPTSGLEQLNQIDRFKSFLESESVLRTVSFSFDGLKRIDLPAALIPKDSAFREGMKFSSVTRLGEKGSTEWEEFYKGPIHCCLIVACSVEADALAATQFELDCLIKRFGDGVQVNVESGWIDRNDAGEVIEHFGYRDGISQPLFFKQEIDDVVASISASHSELLFDPSADPRMSILVPESLAEQSFGSYLVFRKIEQDIAAFQRSRQELANLSELDEKACGALVVGRFEDGTPRSATSNNLNNFNFLPDPQGRQCPFQSHIRKTNTRLDSDNMTRMARRGLSYGKKDFSTTVGLLFFCHVANIILQFEKIQGTWVNSRSASELPAFRCGSDALIATSDVRYANDHKWPIETSKIPSWLNFPFVKCVALKGGEYLYTPSIRLLQGL